VESKDIQCLLLIPSGLEFQSIRVIVSSTLRDIGVNPITLEESIGYGTVIVETVYRVIERADLIIADITSSNPNIMYELGFAHALKKPVLPLVKTGEGHVPTDLRGYLYVVYDPGKLNALRSIIASWVQRNSQALGGKIL
jgi:hypothetical protein